MCHLCCPAGVPKAGTTDLYEKLTGFKQVVHARTKEPFFWSEHAMTAPEYIANFDACGRRAKVIVL